MRLRPPHGVMRVDLDSGADGDVVTNGELSAAIQDDVRTDPYILTNLDVPNNEDVVIA